MGEHVCVCITGAAGQIAYSLIGEICRGGVFGAATSVSLHLLDIEPMLPKLRGVVMEIEDCAYPLVQKVVATHDPDEAFRGAAYCLLVGAMPRRDGMQRKDLLRANAAIFAAQGRAIARVARKDVCVLVVGNPANTNALLVIRAAGAALDPARVTALTRLDMNRARAQIAQRAGAAVARVRNVVIWGNHSGTQFPDASHAVVDLGDGAGCKPVADVPACDAAWLQGDFVATVQQRGAAVIKARGLSSAASAAKAIADHVRDWHCGTADGEMTSMGVFSDGNPYGVAEGLVFSFPVRCLGAGKIEIVRGLAVSEFARGKLAITEAELNDERDAALPFLENQ